MNRRREQRAGRPATGPAEAGSGAPGSLGRPPGGVVEVAAGLVFRHGRLLITQRHPEAHLGGLWEFPGGKREDGETWKQCLVRELREELGISVRVGELVQSITHEYQEQTVHLKFFRCDWKRGEPELLGCASFKWIPWSELVDYEFPAADRRLIETLRTSPGLWVRERGGTSRGSRRDERW